MARRFRRAARSGVYLCLRRVSPAIHQPFRNRRFDRHPGGDRRAFVFLHRRFRGRAFIGDSFAAGGDFRWRTRKLKIMSESFHKNLIVLSALILSFLGVLDLSAQEKNADKIKLKKITANVVTDGKIEAAEWRGAAEFPLAGGGKIFFKFDGEFLHVGVNGLEKGWCHLYLTENRGEKIRVLHASAALGAVVYRRSAKDLWQPEKPFAWNLRETILNEKTEKKLDDYLAENGWMANNNNLGSGNEIEFSIKIEKEKRKNYKLAAVYTSDGKKVQFFPTALTGDALDSELIYGKTPPDLDFKIKSWTAFVFK